ncbi:MULTISPECIES: murein hydrolase activator EnvC family protein [unclassified Tenacibaculum]|uniref:murein hydrolase activator EnvC family protein n=1 Tax=unclassified Tenacibaculum TaxID=2635139 RepID=UPI001F3DF6A9|nr:MULTISPECIES: peptidoglycan DD-metalloendopeptidase family protein [unclassified Tenacibaculum]MCF2874801.1 peptidoglycan DD-metalloendopeptidase family protein [Tenacibaculum sp. Cn5-1]MCF2934133.1 peptidoglycan DD-metalloendopeptidase family protein [Tenacibaculum sp. Cn5-34]MCG7510343.1 peptidoglycan DD-metalloendopeptidase family protein [Tenacibaculum sp. Cn5-46]
MKKHTLFTLSFLCLFLASFSSFGQSRKALENKRKKLKNEIKQVNTLLIKTVKKKSNALDDLKDLSQKINARERLIETIELEAKLLSKEIDNNEKQLKDYNNQLKNLKKEYADMVVKTHKSKSQQSKTMFLLSSESFYQAYKRIKYMQQYSDYRKKQGEEIIVKTKDIQKLNDSLIERKKSKELLITDEKDQKDKIESDKKSQEKLISKIKRQEKKYKRDLQKKLKEEKRITARIDRLIRNAIARANKNKKNNKKKSSSASFVLNAAEKKLLANFEQNKGRLPWPVHGIITRKFGVQPHPTFPGINVSSPGLHITTKANTDAQSIFNGKVLAIQTQLGGKKSVLVQHGNYISAYNNLEKVYVKKGNSIKTGDKLGKVFTDKISGKTKLVFILYKNIVRLNPALWIRSK